MPRRRGKVVRVNHSAVSLEDKYTLDSGRVYITGIQALVRLPMMQRQRDAAAGLNTAGYVSGYRGSPLGGFDNALSQAKPFLEAHHVRFHPGLNEDLAATAVWGSQHTEVFPGAKYDGVFAIWYGKGPGVDRSGDVLKHGNFAGAGKNGGVLCIAGDDHGAKSSAMPHQSEQAFVAALMPVLNPSSVQEYLDLGLFGFAASRYSGCWMGFKAISDTVESSASVLVDPHRLKLVTPTDFELPAGGLNIDVEYYPIPYEERLLEQKLPAVLAFARANPVDRVILSAPRPRIGIVTAGKAYLDLRQALDDLGIDERVAAEIGLCVYKLALTWPIEPEGMIRFAGGLDEIIVVEEKRGFIEDQLTRLFYNRADAPARIVGKRDETGRPLLPERGELSPGIVAKALAARLRRPGGPAADDADLDRRLVQRLSRLDQIAGQAAKTAPVLSRSPYFCSGCPHNTSTRLPDGSRAMAGIGCHAMAMFHPERRTVYATHMGGEGVNWIGHAPFTEEPHVFANLGDGTYDHSGLLAVRAAIAAGVNITYKILYNDAVAMTGGQPLGGEVRVDSIVRQMVAEGAEKVVVMSDEPEKYPAGYLPRGVPVHHRDDLDRVQRELRETPGVTVLVYDQTCAAEKRRRRKRGLMADPPKRAFINHLVCEGCGDCSTASNCVSVQPLETVLGRKRRIDQSNCNKDFSCVEGFCPSFVTVHGGQVRKAAGPGVGAAAGGGTAGGRGADPFADLPEPVRPGCAEPYGILVTGIGGTGVITIGALLGMASHVEGKGVTVLDSTGLAQKNGAVASHVRIAERAEDLHATRIGAGAVRLLLGCDMVTTAAPESLATIEQGVSRAVINGNVNGNVTPPAAFVIDNTIDLSSRLMARQITDVAGRERVDFVEATALATAPPRGLDRHQPVHGWLRLAEGAHPARRRIDRGGHPPQCGRGGGQPAGVRMGSARGARSGAGAGNCAPPDGRAGGGRSGRAGNARCRHRAPGRPFSASTRTARGRSATADSSSGFGWPSASVRRGRAGSPTQRPGISSGSCRTRTSTRSRALYTSGEFEAGLRRQFEGDFKLRFHLAPRRSSPGVTPRPGRCESASTALGCSGRSGFSRGCGGCAGRRGTSSGVPRSGAWSGGSSRSTARRSARVLDGLTRENHETAVAIRGRAGADQGVRPREAPQRGGPRSTREAKLQAAAATPAGAATGPAPARAAAAAGGGD